ncbi:MAG: hypothetical protein OZ928_10520 [Polyangiaceae bacterium]|nr:hypothetical protein [Polyangiaceae bacterium]
MTSAVRWRWTPFYALVGAALSYVGLVVLAVPDRIGEAKIARSPQTGFAPDAGVITTDALGSGASGARRSRTLRPSPGSNAAAANAFGFDTPPPSPVTPAIPRAVESPPPAVTPEFVAPPPPPPPPPPPEPVGQEEEEEEEVEAPPAAARIIGRPLARPFVPNLTRAAPAPSGGDTEEPAGDDEEDPPAEPAPPANDSVVY